MDDANGILIGLCAAANVATLLVASTLLITTALLVTTTLLRFSFPVMPRVFVSFPGPGASTQERISTASG